MICYCREVQSSPDQRHPQVQLIVWWEPGGLWNYQDPVLTQWDALGQAGEALRAQTPDRVAQAVAQGQCLLLPAGDGFQIALLPGQQGDQPPCKVGVHLRQPAAAVLRHPGAVKSGRASRDVRELHQQGIQLGRGIRIKHSHGVGVVWLGADSENLQMPIPELELAGDPALGAQRQHALDPLVIGEEEDAVLANHAFVFERVLCSFCVVRTIRTDAAIEDAIFFDDALVHVVERDLPLVERGGLVERLDALRSQPVVADGAKRLHRLFGVMRCRAKRLHV